MAPGSHMATSSLCELLTGDWYVTSLFLDAAGDRHRRTCCSRSTACWQFSGSRLPIPFIVFTSGNAFAIMGLRALYFLLAGVMTLLRYINYGLSPVLGFHRREDDL